jgi:hypothetical protein
MLNRRGWLNWRPRNVLQYLPRHTWQLGYVHRDKERLVAREQLCARSHVETADGLIYGEVPLSRCCLSHKIAMGRHDYAKQRFFSGLHSYAARGKGLRTALDAF